MVALYRGELVESDEIRYNGSRPAWTEKVIDLGTFTHDGRWMWVVGSDRVHLKFRLVSIASGWIGATGGDGFVRLEWLPAPPAAEPVRGYTVYRGSFPGSLRELVKVGNQTSYCDTAVTNGQLYYYTVAAYDSTGERAGYNIDSATPGHRPGPPGNLKAAPGNLMLELSWEPPADCGGPGITAYQVYRSAWIIGEMLPVALLGNETKYTDKNVENGTGYIYMVAAKNSFGEGERSQAAGGSPGREPSTPTGLRGFGSGDTIHLSWAPPADAGLRRVTGYVVHRSNGSEPWRRFETGQKTEMDDELDRSEAQIFYNVTASNEFGESGPSPTVQLVSPQIPPMLDAFFGPGGAHLRWRPPLSDGGCAIRYYNVYRLGNSTEPGWIGRTADNRTSYTDPSATGPSYGNYSIAGVNAVGEGRRSPAAALAVDSSIPVAYIERPMADAFLRTAAIEVSGGAADPVGVELVELSCLPNSWVICNGTERWTATMVLGEGPAFITARVTDFSGNRNTTTISVTVALMAPLVRVENPHGGAVVTEELVDVTLAASDACRLARVEVSADGASWSPAGWTGAWTAVLRLRPGANTVQARAADAAGNQNVTGITVWYDTQAPRLNISSPVMWQRFGKGETIPVRGQASDEVGVLSVEIRMDNGPWTAVNGTGDWAIDLSANPGRHTLQARATDLGGRQSVTGVNITVEQPAGPYRNPEQSSKPQVVVLVALGAVVAVLSLIWIWGRPRPI